jgi:hypothetical protein
MRSDALIRGSSAIIPRGCGKGRIGALKFLERPTGLRDEGKFRRRSLLIQSPQLAHRYFATSQKPGLGGPRSERLHLKTPNGENGNLRLVAVSFEAVAADFLGPITRHETDDERADDRRGDDPRAEMMMLERFHLGREPLEKNDVRDFRDEPEERLRDKGADDPRFSICDPAPRVQRSQVRSRTL